MNRTRRL